MTSTPERKITSTTVSNRVKQPRPISIVLGVKYYFLLYCSSRGLIFTIIYFFIVLARARGWLAIRPFGPPCEQQPGACLILKIVVGSTFGRLYYPRLRRGRCCRGGNQLASYCWKRHCWCRYNQSLTTLKEKESRLFNFWLKGGRGRSTFGRRGESTLWGRDQHTFPFIWLLIDALGAKFTLSGHETTISSFTPYELRETMLRRILL